MQCKWSPLSIWAGEIGQTYSPLNNGDYAVVINQNNCIDTSECYNVILVSIIENNLKNNCTIFPNPTQGDFTINFGITYNEILIDITDMTGKIIFTIKETNSSYTRINKKLPAGEYLVNIKAKEKNAVLKILIQ